jgi:hypothetical protein
MNRVAILQLHAFPGLFMIQALRKSLWLLPFLVFFSGCNDRETIEKTIVQPLPSRSQEMPDDRLEDKKVQFLPELVDRRPLKDWEVNQSESIIALNVQMVREDQERLLLQLQPTYAELRSLDPQQFGTAGILPSVNMVDGKVKQFDDGLFAALETLALRGSTDCLASYPDMFRRWLKLLPADSEAAAFLQVGISLAKDGKKGMELEIKNPEAAEKWSKQFTADAAKTKPISFYTWSEDLKNCWHFMNFFETSFPLDSPVLRDLQNAVAKDQELLNDYRSAVAHYSGLSNPGADLSLADLVDINLSDLAAVNAKAQSIGLTVNQISLFPQATSRESELINKLFPQGIPSGTDFMMELVRRIRSGEVDLTPRSSDSLRPSGWYDHQVYALETLLLSEKGEEFNKLLLSKSYKLRMLDAFKAMITKRRETHARTIMTDAKSPAAKPLESIQPRLRVEPAPTYYLRTARSYQFIEQHLLKTLGPDCLKKLKGLKQSSERELSLGDELAWMKQLFFGLYLVSCDDIGLKPSLSKTDEVDQAKAYESANSWLANVWSDPDLAVDTRVAVPIFLDRINQRTHLWITTGVRLTKLDTRYATPPRIRPAGSSEDWQVVESKQLKNSLYLVAVDEFAQIEVPGIRTISREELREALPSGKTREEVISILEERFSK